LYEQTVGWLVGWLSTLLNQFPLRIFNCSHLLVSYSAENKSNKNIPLSLQWIFFLLAVKTENAYSLTSTTLYASMVWWQTQG